MHLVATCAIKMHFSMLKLSYFSRAPSPSAVGCACNSPPPGDSNFPTPFHFLPFYIIFILLHLVMTLFYLLRVHFNFLLFSFFLLSFHLNSNILNWVIFYLIFNSDFTCIHLCEHLKGVFTHHIITRGNIIINSFLVKIYD